jgi:hypothetical protein
MTREALERIRARKVTRAEQRSGLTDGGVYRLPGHESLVRVSVLFYPNEHWIIEDVDISKGGASIPDTGRALTDETKAKLESWL